MTARPVLPSKYLRRGGDPVELDMTDASYSGGTSSHTDMDGDRYPFGLTEIVTSDDAALTKITIPLDDVVFWDAPVIDLCVWVEAASALYQTAITLAICPDNPPTMYKWYSKQSATLVTGWNQITLSSWTQDVGGGGGWNWRSPMKSAQFKLAAASGKTARVRIADPVLRWRQNADAPVVMCFDNGFHSINTKALPIMEAAGIKGTEYIVSEWMDTNQYTGVHLVPMFSMDDLDELYAAGWCLSNHTKDHTYLDAENAPTVQVNLDIIAPCQDFLSDNGFARGLKHFIQPNDDNTENTFTALSQLGIKTNQRGNWGYEPYSLTQATDMYDLTSMNGALDTVENTCAAMDRAMAAKAPFFLHFHDVIDEGAQNMDILTSNFQLIIDHIVARGYKTATMDEWYAAFMGNPRYRSLPIGRAIL